MTTEQAIREVLSRGPHNERSLVDALRGLLGEEPDDWGDVRDELVDKGEVVYEVDEYHQIDIYSLAERPVPTKQLANNAVEIAAFNASDRHYVDFPDEITRDHYLLVVNAVLGSIRTSEFNERTAEQAKEEAYKLTQDYKCSIGNHDWRGPDSIGNLYCANKNCGAMCRGA